jgi:predicted acylesterase/phospholipase RssA
MLGSGMPTDVLTNVQPGSKDPGARPIRFLSLDGGGMRGHYTAAVLDQLCRRFSDENRDGAHFDLGAQFDGVVGVSTGSIIAAGLALGVSPLEVVEFYRSWGPKIFADPVPDFDSMSAPRKWLAYTNFLWRHRNRAFNSADVLRDGLSELLGDSTFDSLLAQRGIALLVPTVDLSTHKFWVNKTSHVKGKHRDDNTSLVDACLASSSAPYFFPVAYTDRPFVDGGLAANNPILLALIEAMEMTKTERERPIEIVSVGTCPPPVGDHVKSDDRNWGFMQWRLVERFSAVVLDAQVSMHVSTARFLLPHIDRKATIFRLHQSEPNADQARRLGLDRANSEALGILELRGKIDAETIHSEVLSGADPRLAPVGEIFSGAKIINKEKE